MEHFDINAERSLIMLLASGNNQSGKVFSTIKDDDMFDNVCKRRLEKLRKAYRNGQLKEFGMQHVHQLEMPADLLPLWEAVSIIVNHSIRRKIEKAVNDVIVRTRDYSEGITELQSDLKASMLEAIDPRACKSPSSTKDDLDSFIDSMQNTNISFYTGLNDVDRLAPIQNKDFVVIGARPSVGKSALLSGFLLENMLGRDNKKGLFFCIEMDVRQNYARLSSQMTSVPLNKYINSANNPPTKGELSQMMKSIEEMNKTLPDKWFIEGSVTLQEICDMTEIHKPDYIVVDYVQLIKASGEGQERLANISTTLRNLALTQNVAVIAIAQLNRDANGAVPSMSQIKGSGQFEQDATHIFLLDRPESEKLNSVGKRNYYDKQGKPITIHNPDSPTNLAALICSKNRNGPTFYTILKFDPQTTSFTEWE